MSLTYPAWVQDSPFDQPGAPGDPDSCFGSTAVNVQPDTCSAAITLRAELSRAAQQSVAAYVHCHALPRKPAR